MDLFFNNLFFVDIVVKIGVMSDNFIDKWDKECLCLFVNYFLYRFLLNFFDNL